MSVFTVYCHGTGYNRSKARSEGEAVAWFHDHTTGGEAILHGGTITGGSYVINEGPAHGQEAGIELPQYVAPDTGNVKPRTLLGSKRIANLPGVKNLHNVVATQMGNIHGVGWDQNVVRTMNILNAVHADNPITRVNLIGWSRGGVTCIRIANALHEVYGTQIECNIFAIDPVAGMQRGHEEDKKTISENVKNYIAVLAMDERRRTFKPQDWSRLVADPSKTKIVMLPMPGVHSAQTIVKSPPASAKITRNLAYGFLHWLDSPIWDVPFAELSTPEAMSEAYGELVLAMSERKTFQTTVMKGLAGGGATGMSGRSFQNSKMDTYTRGGVGSYWINEHHRACFRAAYPKAYSAMFLTDLRENKPVGQVDPKLAGVLKTQINLTFSLVSKNLLIPAAQGFEISLGAGKQWGDHVFSPWPAQFPLHA